MEITRDDTLVGVTISAAEEFEEGKTFSLSINKSGIFLSDGVGEIPIEIGEDGPIGNSDWLGDVAAITDREVTLIYEISLYQYAAFRHALCADESVDEEVADFTKVEAVEGDIPL